MFTELKYIFHFVCVCPNVNASSRGINGSFYLNFTRQGEDYITRPVVDRSLRKSHNISSSTVKRPLYDLDILAFKYFHRSTKLQWANYLFVNICDFEEDSYVK